MNGLIDAHIHLDQYPLADMDRLVEQWKQSGVEHVCAVSTNLASSYRTLELKLRYPNFIFAAIGYHPEQLLPSHAELQEMISLIRQEKNQISAIGEVGLPHYLYQTSGSHPPLPSYIELLEIFAEAGAEHDKPLLLHAVHEQAEKALSILQKHQIKKAQFHWLKAPSSVVKQILQEGYYISVTPEICYRERDQKLTGQIPLKQLLLETDGPWRYSQAFADRHTSPEMIADVAVKAAEIKGVDPFTLIKECRRNAYALFN